MDYERALEKVDAYMSLCEASIRVQEAMPEFWRDPQWEQYKRQITEGLPLIERIAQAVDPRLAEKLREADSAYSDVHGHKRDACRELRGAILSRQDEAEILGPQGPKLAAAELHHWVWDHAAQLWSDGHRRSAVQTAAMALFDAHVPAKLGRQRDTRGGADLMGQAFSAKPPEPDAPRLRFSDMTPGSPEWTSAHEGAMKLGQGAAQAIRNPTTHDLSEPDEQEALEMLAVLSYVARLVDRAEVEKAP